METQNKKLFVIQSATQQSARVFSWITTIARFLEMVVLNVQENVFIGESSAQVVDRLIKEADFILCDLSGRNPNVLYELGIAHSLGKIVLLLSDTVESVPFDLRAAKLFIYDLSVSDQKIINELRDYVMHATIQPTPVRGRPKFKLEINSVFISYCHRDDIYLKRLLVHLRPLQKEGKIDLWVDTQIKVGDKWKKTIELALAKARIAILMVSADFLASDFIIDNELPPLLTKAESDGTKIVPIILKPCRFSRDSNLKHFQAVNNPAEPLSQLSDHQKEEIYDKVAQIVEDFMIHK